MTRLAITVAALPGIAAAHPGHLTEAAGHSHMELIAGLALIALAAPIAIRMARRFW